MTMGEKLIKLRKARLWSQEEMAEQVGVSRQAISRWESDSAKPDADNIVTVCNLFGVSADYLLRDGEENSSFQPASESHPSDARGKRLSNVIAGSVLLGLGVLMLFGIGIASSLNPAIFYSGHFVYTGMLGYVLCFDLEWLLVLTIALILIGLIMLLRDFLAEGIKVIREKILSWHR